MGLSEEDQLLLDNFISQILIDERIIGIYHFGSSINEEKYRDIDIALITTESFTSEEKLDTISKKPDKIDLSFLEDLPLYIARHAIQGKLIVNRDEDKIFDTVILIIHKWEDFRPMWELYLDVSINGFGKDH